MSTSASSLNWWYIEGSRRRTYSAGRRDAMSRNTPPCGEPRPALTSLLMARATSSRGSSSGGRRLFFLSSYQRSASRSEEHTSELQSRQYLVCRLLLEKKTTPLLPE